MRTFDTHSDGYIQEGQAYDYMGVRGGGGAEDARPEYNIFKNREHKIIYTEIKEREIRKPYSVDYEMSRAP